MIDKKEKRSGLPVIYSKELMAKLAEPLPFRLPFRVADESIYDADDKVVGVYCFSENPELVKRGRELSKFIADHFNAIYGFPPAETDFEKVDKENAKLEKAK